jgi:NTE family protein
MSLCDIEVTFVGFVGCWRVPEPLVHRPDVLVLAAGGTLGEAWMRGLLDGAGAASGIDFRDCEYFVGTSAGSIVAAFLAAGREPDSGAEARAARDWGAAADDGDGAAGVAAGEAAGGRPSAGDHPDRGPSAADDPERRPLAAAVGRLGLTAAAPFAPLALASAAPGGAVARAAALAAVPRPTRTMPGLGRLVEQAGAEFDGRLRIAAVDRRSGKRVMFGAPGSPPATVAQAVLASCSIPWVFAPVPIDGREYVDGGVWSPTNLDATPARRGTEVLCLNPTAALRPLSTVSNAAALTESLALKARGARVRTIRPDREAAEAMGHNLMDRRRAPEALAAGYAQGRALAGE